MPFRACDPVENCAWLLGRGSDIAVWTEISGSIQRTEMADILVAISGNHQLHRIGKCVPSIVVLSSWEYSPSLYFLQFPIIMSCAHNIIYVELLRFYLRALNSSIMGETVSTLNVNHMLVYHFYEKRKIIFLKNRLKLFKRIHLALWMITEHINSFFGWSITMNLLSNIFDFFMIYIGCICAIRGHVLPHWMS